MKIASFLSNSDSQICKYCKLSKHWGGGGFRTKFVIILYVANINLVLFLFQVHPETEVGVIYVDSIQYTTRQHTEVGVIYHDSFQYTTYKESAERIATLLKSVDITQSKSIRDKC